MQTGLPLRGARCILVVKRPRSVLGSHPRGERGRLVAIVRYNPSASAVLRVALRKSQRGPSGL